MSFFLLASLLIPPPQEVPRPRLTTIEVRADTVWFLADTSRERRASSTASYAYVRSSGEWLRRGPRRDLPRRRHVPHSGGRIDTVEVAPGVSIAHLPNHLRHYHVILLGEDRYHVLPIDPPFELKRTMVESLVYHREELPDERVRSFPVESRVSDWTVHDSVLWMGRAGSWYEDAGGLGGLVSFDLETQEMEALWNEHLANATVTGLAAVDGELWIGTLHPGEYGPYGETGVLIYGLDTGVWRRLTEENSPLPGRVVREVEARGDSVWISTSRGLAAVDAASDSWNVRHFVPTLSGDTLVHELREHPGPPDEVRELGLSLVHRLGVERARAFMEVMEALPRQRFEEALAGPRPLLTSLTHPSFVPFLVATIQRRGNALPLAAEALGEIAGDRSWVPALVEVLDSLPHYRAPPVAIALGKAGHPAGVEWARSRLADPDLPSYEVVHPARVLGALRDTASIAALVDALDDEYSREPAYGALRAMESEAAWRALLEKAHDMPELAPRLLRALERGAPGMPIHDDAFREEVRRIAGTGRSPHRAGSQV